MTYLKNVWYAGAWTDEVEVGKPLARTIIEMPVLFVRKASDRCVGAIHDRCPHRFAPLHLGHQRGDVVQCIYHGLTFNLAGNCTHNPQGAIPKSAIVSAFPTVERDGIVWVWLGRAEAAQPELIPDFSFLTCVPETARIKGYIDSSGHYELMTDNILDLSHADFLHTTTLGSGSISGVRPSVTQDGNAVTVRWISEHQKAAPVYDPFLPEPGMLVDQIVEVTWHPPGLMKLTNAMNPVGHGPDRSVVSTAVHLMTPRGPTATHYFYAGIRNYAMDSAEVNARRAVAIRTAFVEEDKPMIEAIQRVMGQDTDVLSRNPILLPSDGGAIRVRRMMSRLRAAEAVSPGAQEASAAD